MDRSDFVLAVRREVAVHLGALAATPAGVVFLAGVQILVECLTQGPAYFDSHGDEPVPASDGDPKTEEQ